MVDNAAIEDVPRPGNTGAGETFSSRAARHRAGTNERHECFHCGLPCSGARFAIEEKVFCCRGCLAVFELLRANGLDEFYTLAGPSGITGGAKAEANQFAFVDGPAVRPQLVDYSDERLTRVTFHVPSIHCVACVWLLENLYRLQPAIGESQVNFPRKEVAISFRTDEVKLSDVIGLLDSLGYGPELKLASLERQPKDLRRERLWMQLGVAGFAFGNTMLFSIASYLGLDSVSGPGFRRLVGIISALLAAPVVLFSAQDYWRPAWLSLRQRLLNIDVPIAAGLLALFAESCWQVATEQGMGYFDTLTGLIFFLLCGKLFQRVAFFRIEFDRDYRSFFPLSVVRRREGDPEHVSLSDVGVGDQLVIRNGELIPADAELVSGAAVIDYSFVTGEAEPVTKAAGDYLYAGGRQIGAAIEVQTRKGVSQSYLTSLWNQEPFRKGERLESFGDLTNRYSQVFTKLVIGAALLSSLFWLAWNPSLSAKAFISVLIVACPCALALGAPFALGTAQRLLAARKVFLKNASVLERLATVDTIVFDKTGTLTSAQGAALFHGTALSERDRAALGALALQSTHPCARGIADTHTGAKQRIEEFEELPGRGIQGRVADQEICMGSAAWLQSKGVSSRAASVPADQPISVGGSAVHVAIDGCYRGWFEIKAGLKPGLAQMIQRLGGDYEVALLSGDNDREEEFFRGLFGRKAQLAFQQSPLDKLHFVQRLQESGQRVLMVGDGLNDAGALKQSDAGIAVVERMSAFSPASDVIMAAEMVPNLESLLSFARRTTGVVRLSFAISALYNAVGIGIAAAGLLSPIVCAVLMPLSSVSVVAVTCGLTRWVGRGLEGMRSQSDEVKKQASIRVEKRIDDPPCRAVLEPAIPPA
jgi:Cu+-exporting ATPase